MLLGPTGLNLPLLISGECGRVKLSLIVHKSKVVGSNFAIAISLREINIHYWVLVPVKNN